MSERDERLLRQLGERVRAERDDPDRDVLEALVRGELSEGELADLEARAADEPELGQALEAYTPLGSSSHTRIAGQLRAALNAGARVREVPKVRRGARVVRLWLAPGLAAAAALVLWINQSQWREIPDYQLEVLRIDNEFRSHRVHDAVGEPIALSAKVQWICELRPEDAVSASIAAKAFLARGRALAPWPAEVRVSPQGAVRIELAPVRLNVGEAAELVVVVGQADRLDGAVADGWSTARGTGFQRWSVPVVGGE